MKRDAIKDPKPGDVFTREDVEYKRTYTILTRLGTSLTVRRDSISSLTGDKTSIEYSTSMEELQRLPGLVVTFYATVKPAAPVVVEGRWRDRGVWIKCHMCDGKKTIRALLQVGYVTVACNICGGKGQLWKRL